MPIIALVLWIATAGHVVPVPIATHTSMAACIAEANELYAKEANVLNAACIATDQRRT